MAKTALAGSRLNAFAMSPKDLIIAGIDADDPTEGQVLTDPRVHLPLDEGLVKNIMVYGVLEPVLVAKIGGIPFVVDGRQRVRCAREANKRLEREGKEHVRVPTMLKRGEEHLLYGVSISANENRQDDGPLAKADKVQRFLDMGRSTKEAALAFGVTTQTIGMWLKLLELDSKVRKAVERGQISPTAAAQLANLSPEEQREALKNLLAEGRPTVDAAKKAKATNGAAAHSRPTKHQLMRVIKATKEDPGDLSEDFIRGVRWAAGELDPGSIKGLKALLNE